MEIHFIISINLATMIKINLIIKVNCYFKIDFYKNNSCNILFHLISLI